MMRYGIPQLPAPARRSSTPRSNGSRSAGRHASSSMRRVTDILAAMHDGGFDAVFLAVGAQLGQRARTSPPERLHAILDAARRCC